jgi:hypothetical protein
VVMGITWIIGVLVIEVEELFALAYIFTIFVAFQGLFIFVIFVLLSKQVRENYLKWWKAKVAESDFLSSHFGEKHLTLGTSASVSLTMNIRQHSYPFKFITIFCGSMINFFSQQLNAMLLFLGNRI